MVSSINFGSLFNVGNKTITSGTASGFDTKTILEQLYQAKLKPATDLEDTIKLNDSKISALGELRTKYDNLRNSLIALHNPPSSLDSSLNIFKSRQTFITSNTSVPGNTYLGITAQTGADIASYDVTITDLAKAKSQRTNTFTSQTDSVTDAASTNNAGRFSAGTFQIAGGQVTNDINTKSGDILVSADYRVVGSVSGSVLDNTYGTGGISNITAANGDTSFINSLSTAYVSATQAGGAGTDVTLTVRINGKEYVSGAITANTGGGNDVAANTVITFTEADSNTSFEVRTGGSVYTISNSTELAAFASDIDSALGGVSIYQKRTLSSFTQSLATGTALAGLTSSNILLDSNAYNISTGAHGKISDFQVTAVTGPGNNDATIQFTLTNNDGTTETFQATGLGTAGSDTHTDNITFTSTTTSKQFAININDASVTLDFSSTLNAKTIEKDLNTVFGTGVNITLAEGDSLTTIASKINSQSTKSNVSASVIKIADNDYRLTLQSSKTGTANAYRLNDTISNTFTSTVTLNSVQTAQNASFAVNGQTITRALNTVDDVVKGVTFSLFQETPGGTTLRVDVDKNVQGVVDAVNNLISKYNEAKTFAAKQTLTNADGSAAEGAFLGDSLVLDISLNSIISELNRVVSGLTSSPNRISDAGITFFDQPEDTANGKPAVANLLKLDESKLVAQLSSDFDGVRKVFEADFSSPNLDKLRLFSRTNALSITEFDVDIDVARAAGDQIRVSYLNAAGATVTINADFAANTTGGTITGQAGTVIEGLVLLYSGNGNDIINGNTITQGIADRLFNITDGALVDTTGSIDREKTSIQEENTKVESEKADIEETASTFRDDLVIKFSNLEQVVSRVNNALALLDALDKAQQNNNS